MVIKANHTIVAIVTVNCTGWSKQIAHLTEFEPHAVFSIDEWVADSFIFEPDLGVLIWKLHLDLE
jgi:hypothetical protein